MQGHRRKNQRDPQSKSPLADVLQVPCTENANVKPGAAGMYSVDILPRRGTQNLHCVVAGTKQDCAQHVDEDVVRSAVLRHRSRLSSREYSDTAIESVTVTSRANNQKDDVTETHQHCCTKSTRHTHAPSDIAIFLLPQVGFLFYFFTMTRQRLVNMGDMLSRPLSLLRSRRTVVVVVIVQFFPSILFRPPSCQHFSISNLINIAYLALFKSSI